MRKDITFKSKGLRCSGWYYVPDNLATGQKGPAIIMGHGFSAEKEMVLPDYAKKFSQAGFVTLIFDYRYFGESEGEPRHQLFPLDQVEDFRNAISWISGQPEVDPERIGIWGTSYGGGIVTYTAIWDKRVKAVVAQVPAAIRRDYRARLNMEAWKRTGAFLLQDRIKRYKTDDINYFKVVAPNNEPCCFPGDEFYAEYMDLTTRNPKAKITWINGVTVESLEKAREFDAVGMIDQISPAALLLVAAEHDSAIPLDAVRETYEKASQPKSLSVLPIKHFEIYSEPWISRAIEVEIEWYKKYL
jgi:uncharacterized protein